MENSTNTAMAVPQGTAVVTQLPALQPANPFARERDQRTNAGAVAIEESRAIAEAQGKLVIAKRFPRDPFGAWERAVDACRRPGLAAEAFYSFPRGGQTVSGVTIRFAEELARCWGNIDYGLRELSREDGASEMEAFAWDLETNTRSIQQFTVAHIRDKTGGPQKLTDERDKYEITANMGARRLRARILAILPKDLVDACVAQCKKTIANADSELPMTVRVQRMVQIFATIGVNTTHLETYLGCPLAQVVPEQLADLHGVFKSIKDKETTVGDWFGVKLAEPAAAETHPMTAGIQRVQAAVSVAQNQTAAGEPAQGQTAAADSKPAARRGRPPGSTKAAAATPAAEPAQQQAPAAPAEPRQMDVEELAPTNNPPAPGLAAAVADAQQPAQVTAEPAAPALAQPAQAAAAAAPAALPCCGGVGRHKPTCPTLADPGEVSQPAAAQPAGAGDWSAPAVTASTEDIF